MLARTSAPARKTRGAAAVLQKPATSQALYAVGWASLALVLCGLAAMGLEIVWLRHFTLLLGGFRAVFSLVLTIVLVGIGLGSLLGGYIDRRTSRPAQALMVVQALLVVSALLGLSSTGADALDAHRRAIDATFSGLTPFGRWMTELWYNARPMLLEIGVPSLLMGCSFPLANALIQRTERAVGSRAGALYLANTAGAVFGSLATGFVLLPVFGMQGSATVLALVATLAIAPLYLAAREDGGVRTTSAMTTSVPVLIAAVCGRPVAAPAAGLRAEPLAGQTAGRGAAADAPRRYHRSDRRDGSAGPGPRPHHQRPPDVIDRVARSALHARAGAYPAPVEPAPTRVLVIGFGVGNSTQAATLHPSVERVDVADLSRDILITPAISRREQRRAQGPTRQRIRERRPAAPRHAADGGLRPHYAGAAADCARRRRRPVFTRVLRARALTV